MPKTRQQRLAEERAGHPPSPPRFLEDQLAVLGEPQALLHVWVDAGPEASGRQSMIPPTK